MAGMPGLSRPPIVSEALGLQPVEMRDAFFDAPRPQQRASRTNADRKIMFHLVRKSALIRPTARHACGALPRTCASAARAPILHDPACGNAGRQFGAAVSKTTVSA